MLFRNGELGSMIKQTMSGDSYIHDMVSIEFEMLYTCDKACSYCYNPIPRYFGAKTDAKEQVWKKIMGVEGPLQVILLGGESTFFKPVFSWWNEYCAKYKDDESKHLIIYTHGNNKPEVYDKFIEKGNKRCYLGFSYHPGQTDEDLYFYNIERLRNRGVNIVVCQVITDDTSTWEHNWNILKRVKDLGCDTQIEFFVSKETGKRGGLVEAQEYFSDFVYQDCHVQDLHFTGNEELNILRSEYNAYFPKGLSNVHKICRNRTYLIDANCRLKYECQVNGLGVDLVNDIDGFDDFIKPKGISCKQECPSSAAVLNDKTFFANSIEEITQHD